MRFSVLIFIVIVSAFPAQAEDSVPSFNHDVMAVLSKTGCNLGTCHGNQNGKGGLKLSLRGQRPDRDYLALARELGSRRVNALEPMESLLLKKPLAEIPHQGGKRFDRNSLAYDILSRWIAARMPEASADEIRLVDLKVTPALVTVLAPTVTAQLNVTAEFSDGSSRDVTRLAVFEPSSLFVSVSDDGVAHSERPGVCSVMVRYLNRQRAIRLEFVEEPADFQWNHPESFNFIDDEIFATLQRLRINPSPLCTDSAFVRRVFLDLTGLLPPAATAKQFVESTEPAKRATLIDQLLDSPEFNDFQTLRWADLLRVEEKTLDKKGVEVFHDWIHKSFADHKPLNQFAAELIAARGSTYEQPPANFYRALRQPEPRAEATAQIFLGIRLQCAKCHNHPFDRWTQEDYYGWSNFFAKIDYNIIENKRRDKSDKNEFAGEQVVLIKAENKDVRNPETGQPAALRFLGDAPATTELDDTKQDRLEQLAVWLTAKENRTFAATQANRIWFHLLGRGLVDPVDDFRSTNPPSHPGLLERLTDELIASNYDVRHLMRLIANSETYQLDTATNPTNVNDHFAFSHAEPARLTAEQMLDGMAAVLQEAVQFGGHSTGTRAVQLKGVRGGFRYAEPESGDRFMLLFGKPGRLQTCECERSNSATLAQTFEMVSGELINELVQRKSTSFSKAIAKGTAAEKILADLYWSALSRAPSTDEQSTALKYIAAQNHSLEGWQDIAWALLNSNEFLLRR